MHQLLRALDAREKCGKSTRLRQLHHISQLSQHEALRVVAMLEGDGFVVVERDLGDAFESVVTLQPKAHTWLEQPNRERQP